MKGFLNFAWEIIWLWVVNLINDWLLLSNHTYLGIFAEQENFWIVAKCNIIAVSPKFVSSWN
jgi:hypothetical protein